MAGTFDDLRKTAGSNAVWVETEYGFKLFVAPMNNPEYLSCLRDLMRPHRSKLRQFNKTYTRLDSKDQTAEEAMSAEELEQAGTLLRELTAKAMARHVILDWSGLTEATTGEDGEVREIAYSVEECESRLRIPKFYDLCGRISSDEAIFVEEQMEESRGN